MSPSRDSHLVLFDVDGTLTPSRLLISEEMDKFLDELRKRVTVGIVGGSDYVKQQEQLGGGLIEKKFDYVFSENGLVSYKNGQLHEVTTIKDFLGEAKIAKFVNFCLHYIADLELPKKRGTFVEFRSGMINVCPIGRNCSQEERIEFFEYDQTHKVREAMVAALEKQFPDLGLQFSIGGQISFDVFPKGWDKTYCLRHVADKNFAEIHFFGDKTHKGGNDYELYEHERVIGHRVTSPADTKQQCEQLFLSA